MGHPIDNRYTLYSKCLGRVSCAPSFFSVRVHIAGACPRQPCLGSVSRSAFARCRVDSDGIRTGNGQRDWYWMCPARSVRRWQMESIRCSIKSLWAQGLSITGTLILLTYIVHSEDGITPLTV